MKKRILTIGLIISTMNLAAQCDRGFVKNYQGTIIRKTVDDTTIVNIVLPSDFILINEKKNKSYLDNYTQEEIVLNEKQNNFNETFTFLGPCEGIAEAYLKSVFIAGIQKYKITVVTSLRNYDKIIDIEDIEFEIKGNKIQVILPPIEI